MNRPTQTIHIMDGRTRYTFDAVIKAEHTHTMDILEDRKDAKGKSHVRYAVRKPSTLSLEVSVTDTVVIWGDVLSRGANSRSESAYQNFYKLMQKRNYLKVITRMYTFEKMMISDFVVTEDPEHQNEMYASIGLKEMVASAAPKKTSNTKPETDETTDTPRIDPSVLFEWMGGVQY